MYVYWQFSIDPYTELYTYEIASPWQLDFFTSEL